MKRGRSSLDVCHGASYVANEVVSAAIKSVPFYAGRRALNELPIVSREMIIDDPMQFVNSALMTPSTDIVRALKHGFNSRMDESTLSRNLIIEQTSGSSGMPLRFLRTKGERSKLALGIWNYRKSIDPSVTTGNFRAIIHGRANEVMRLNITKRTSDGDTQIVEFLNDRTIRWIHANPKIFSCFSEIVSKCPRREGMSGLMFGESSGKVLSPQQWECFENALQITIVNQYGTRETWAIGYARFGDSFSILENNVFVEIVDENGQQIVEPEKMGRIIVTNLHQILFPFIRYDTGDRGCWMSNNGTRKLELARHREHEILRGCEVTELGTEVFKSLMIRVNKRLMFPANRRLKIMQRTKALFVLYVDTGSSNELLRATLEEEFNKLSLFPGPARFVLGAEILHDEDLESKDSIFSSRNYAN